MLFRSRNKKQGTKVVILVIVIIVLFVIVNVIVIKIGRASCRERVYISVVDVELDKKYVERESNGHAQNIEMEHPIYKMGTCIVDATMVCLMSELLDVDQM